MDLLLSWADVVERPNCLSHLRHLRLLKFLCRCLAGIVTSFVLCDLLSSLPTLLRVCISVFGIPCVFTSPRELGFSWLVSGLVVCIFVFCGKSTSLHPQSL